MNIHKIHAPRYTHGRKNRGHYVQYFCILMAGFIMVLALSAGSAWSFEIQSEGGAETPQNDAPQNKFSSNGNSLSLAGSCLTLLKSLRDSAPVSPAENYRHSAGSSAAFGLVIGLRFALSQPGNARKKPAKDRKPQLGIWQMQNPDMEPRHALALSSYRQCRNQQMLKALSEFGSGP